MSLLAMHPTFYCLSNERLVNLTELIAVSFLVQKTINCEAILQWWSWSLFTQNLLTFLVRLCTNVLLSWTKWFSTSRRLLVFSNLCHALKQRHSLPRTGTIPNLTQGLPPQQRICDVNKVIAVASAKGGVGGHNSRHHNLTYWISNISLNLAPAMVQTSKQVRLLDADIFGPSVPQLLNLSGQPWGNQGNSPAFSRLHEDNRLVPLVNYDLKAISVGFLVPLESPIVWRGLMVIKALQ